MNILCGSFFAFRTLTVTVSSLIPAYVEIKDAPKSFAMKIPTCTHKMMQLNVSTRKYKKIPLSVRFIYVHTS